MKKIIQTAMIVLGVVALVYGIIKMSAETATLILPKWLVIFIVTSFVCLLSVGIGFLAKYLFKSNWHSLTFASIVVSLTVIVYATVADKPMLKIIVSSDYAGEVKLFVSRDMAERNVINVNNFGIGYISRKNFEEGFNPKIIKGNKDISKEIIEYSKGASLNSLSDSYSFKYLSFDIAGGANALVSNIDTLIRIGAIDTLRLPKAGTP